MGKTCAKVKAVTCNSTPTDRKQTPTTTVHEDKHGSVIRSDGRDGFVNPHAYAAYLSVVHLQRETSTPELYR